MKTVLRKLASVLCVLLFTGQLHAEVVPYLRADLLGGQYFYNGKSGSMSANGDLTGSLSFDLGNWMIVPIYEGVYQTTQQVFDLTGGGTLFSQMMSHRVSVEGVYEFAYGWLFKPEAGYKYYFLNETTDESWGTGLFDYRRINGSLTVEHTYSDPFSLRFTLDAYSLKFPNYQSLESQIGGGMARELNGTDVINSNNLAFTAAMNGRAGRFLWDGSVSGTRAYFDNQHVINAQGQFNSPTRVDNVFAGSVVLKMPVQVSGKSILSPGVNFGVNYNDSNQNDYDATQSKFVPSYYDYVKFNGGADINYRSLVPGYDNKFMSLTAGFYYGRTNYRSRLVQSAAGVYSSDTVYLNEYIVRANGSYPIGKQFDLVSSIVYGNQTSNMQYEKLYAYNFNIFTYLFGVRYEFE
ncbi:MAG: hypothetical protein WCS77_05455 [Elusimicrobiaceae bacterium]